MKDYKMKSRKYVIRKLNHKYWRMATDEYIQQDFTWGAWYSAKQFLSLEVAWFRMRKLRLREECNNTIFIDVL